MPNLKIPDIKESFKRGIEEIATEILGGVAGEWQRTSSRWKLEKGSFNSPLPHPMSDGARILFEPPEGGTFWRRIYESQTGGKILLSVTALILLLFLLRQGANLVNADGPSSGGVGGFWTGALLSISWYWIGVGFLMFIQILVLLVAPPEDAIRGYEQWSWLESMMNTGSDQAWYREFDDIAKLIVMIPIVFINAMIRMLVGLVYDLQTGVVLIQFLFMPVIILGRYSGISYLEQKSKKLISKFVSISLMPVVGMAMMHGYLLMLDCRFHGRTGAGSEYRCMPSGMPWYPEGLNNGLRPLVLLTIDTMLMFMILLVAWKTFRSGSEVAARATQKTKRAGLATAVTGAYVAGKVGKPAVKKGVKGYGRGVMAGSLWKNGRKDLAMATAAGGWKGGLRMAAHQRGRRRMTRNTTGRTTPGGSGRSTGRGGGSGGGPGSGSGGGPGGGSGGGPGGGSGGSGSSGGRDYGESGHYVSGPTDSGGRSGSGSGGRSGGGSDSRSGDGSASIFGTGSGDGSGASSSGGGSAGGSGSSGDSSGGGPPEAGAAQNSEGDGGGGGGPGGPTGNGGASQPQSAWDPESEDTTNETGRSARRSSAGQKRWRQRREHRDGDRDDRELETERN